jgi:serine/arginine repetitive matrix protein 2
MRHVTIPSLSRRFTLLRSSSGDPVSLDDLKSRLAEQRARGAENHLSEEEEDMFLQTLGRLRSKPSSSSTSGDSTYGPSRDSVRSGETLTSSVTSSPASSKRYSNNMFGSGKFKDYTYIRSVAKERAGKVSAGRRSASSTALSISSPSGKSSNTSIPEESSQTEPDPTTHDSGTTLLVESSTGELEQSIIKTFQPSHLRRASIAVEEVIRELEEVEGDGDDEILIPRSPAPERASTFNKRSVSGCVECISLLFYLISRLHSPPSPLEFHYQDPVCMKLGLRYPQILEPKQMLPSFAPPHLPTLALKPHLPLDSRATFQACRDP